MSLSRYIVIWPVMDSLLEWWHILPHSPLQCLSNSTFFSTKQTLIWFLFQFCVKLPSNKIPSQQICHCVFQTPRALTVSVWGPGTVKEAKCPRNTLWWPTTSFWEWSTCWCILRDATDHGQLHQHIYCCISANVIALSFVVLWSFKILKVIRNSSLKINVSVIILYSLEHKLRFFSVMFQSHISTQLQ